MSASATHPTQLFVVVERASARMRMRLVPVQDDGEHPPAVNRGMGIVPLEALGERDDRALTEVYHAFRRLELPDAACGNVPDRLANAFSAWRDALALSGIDLRLERRALYGMALPHTDWRGSSSGISARPWDVELTALAAGLRTIVKLDGVPAELVETLRALVEQRGLRVEVVAQHTAAGSEDPSRSVTLLVARDGSTLGEARELEALLLAPRGAAGVTAATIRMGALLGYPPCCTDRFTRVAAQNDTTLAWALLPGVPHPPASPATQWLHPALALLSHSPCDLHCAASVALGERLVDEIEATQPSFAAAWRSLTARVQVIDHRGDRLALTVDGSLESGATITAADIVASGRSDPHVTATAEMLVGRTVRSDTGGLTIAGGGWHAPYVADHRGPS
ncbi:MAG: hypothetical protein IT294_09865 [Deltaproteobacteria bacterium]|nr:hypothetical protein [Deltaproteobacteria bacterium]